MIKPIHKLNGGLGATLCNYCNKIISIGFTDNLHCDKKCEAKHRSLILMNLKNKQ